MTDSAMKASSKAGNFARALCGGSVVLAAAFCAVTPVTAQVTEPAVVETQKQWTIAQLQQQTLKTGPLVAALAPQVEAAFGRQIAARAYPNPSIEFLSGNNKPRITGPQTGNTSEVMLSQPLEWPDARNARIQSASQSLDVAKFSAQQSVNDVLSDVRLRALEWLIRQEEIRFLQDAVDLLNQIRERVTVKVNTGEAAKYELIKADAEVLSALARLDAARAQSEATRMRLSQLVGITLDNEFSVKEPRRSVPDLQAAELTLQRLESTNPEIMQRASELNAAQFKLDEQRALRKPAVEVRAKQSQDAELRNQQLGLMLNIPLFDQRQGLVREAQANVTLARARLDGRRYEIKLQSSAAYAALLAATRRVQALEGGVLKQAEAAVSVSQAAYKFGERGILDTLDAQRVLRSVRSDITQARLEAFSAAVELDRLSGAYLSLVPEQNLSE